MVKLSTHQRNLYYIYILVTPSSTKEDNPVSVRIYSI